MTSVGKWQKCLGWSTADFDEWGKKRSFWNIVTSAIVSYCLISQDLKVICTFIIIYLQHNNTNQLQVMHHPCNMTYFHCKICSPSGKVCFFTRFYEKKSKGITMWIYCLFCILTLKYLPVINRWTPSSSLLIIWLLDQ